MNKIVKPIIDSNDILKLAKEKLIIDRRITEIIQQENPDFSYKKLTADLGEYYAKKILKLSLNP